MDSPAPSVAPSLADTPKLTPEAEVDLNFGGEVEIEYVVTTGDIDEWRRVAEPGVAQRFAPQRAAPEVSERQRYLSGKLLGKGGMGEVRLCKDQLIGRSVAMKTMLPGYTKNEELLGRFLREAQVQGQLEHPAIAPLYDLGTLPDGTLFFTMRRLRGRTLSAVLAGLRAGNPTMVSLFSPSRLLQAFTTVCMAIDYAHSRGVLHRDLKPHKVRADPLPGRTIPRPGPGPVQPGF
jgi:serine/threonine-protein kinase